MGPARVDKFREGGRGVQRDEFLCEGLISHAHEYDHFELCCLTLRRMARTDIELLCDVLQANIVIRKWFTLQLLAGKQLPAPEGLVPQGLDMFLENLKHLVHLQIRVWGYVERVLENALCLQGKAHAELY